MVIGAARHSVDNVPTHFKGETSDLFDLIKIGTYLQPVREQCPLPEQNRRQAGPRYTGTRTGMVITFSKRVFVHAYLAEL